MNPTTGRLMQAAERGSSSLELCLGCLGWAMGLAVLAFAYQVQSGSDDVADAAAQGARAAALTAAPQAAQREARTIAMNRLTSGACAPGTVVVTTDVTEFRAGGTVRVSVSCRLDPALGPRLSLTSSSDEVLDRYRGGL